LGWLFLIFGLWVWFAGSMLYDNATTLGGFAIVAGAVFMVISVLIDLHIKTEKRLTLHG